MIRFVSHRKMMARWKNNMSHMLIRIGHLVSLPGRTAFMRIRFPHRVIAIFLAKITAFAFEIGANNMCFSFLPPSGMLIKEPSQGSGGFVAENATTAKQISSKTTLPDLLPMI